MNNTAVHVSPKKATHAQTMNAVRAMLRHEAVFTLFGVAVMVDFCIAVTRRTCVVAAYLVTVLSQCKSEHAMPPSA